MDPNHLQIEKCKEKNYLKPSLDMPWQFLLPHYVFHIYINQCLLRELWGRGPGFSCGLDCPKVFYGGGDSLSFSRSQLSSRPFQAEDHKYLPW